MARLSHTEAAHRFASMNARRTHQAMGIMTGKMKPVPKAPPPNDEPDQEPEATEEG